MPSSSQIPALTVVPLKRKKQRALSVERLEPRQLLATAPQAALALHSGQGGVCSCPVCTGQGLDQIPTVEQSPSGPAASNPLSSLPQLSSNPGAAARLYLDFNGHFQASWGSDSNVSTPVFDQDGDATTFSDGELATIQQVWNRVAEDYSPFNIDVTTIAPGSQANGVVAHIAIGGNWSDWFGASAGGVAYIGGFYNSAPNVGYVFEAALGNGNPRYVAEAASHEAGHLFGLLHQANWNGSTLVEEYHSGDGDWAPIMGVGYYATRTTWHDGATSDGPSDFQNDMAILANGSNGFGYRADDHPNSLATAAALPITGTTANVSGRIGSTTDLDVFSFTTGGGSVSFQLNVATHGPNLDSMLQLWNAAGNLLVSAAPGASLGASITTTLGAGTFYVIARSAGGYGNVGRYSITGTVPEPLPPEIELADGATNLSPGDTVIFGSTTLGAPVSKVFTVSNTGAGSLSLTSIDAGDLPAGFELVSNLGSTLLAPGGTTTFEVRLGAVDAGNFEGTLEIGSNDAEENPFAIALDGQVVGAEITVDVSGVDVTSGETVSFGAPLIGTPALRTFNVANTGTTTLSLVAIDPAGVPAGFTLVQNVGSTSLLPGESTTFVVQLDSAAAGSYAGQFTLVSDDASESTFTIDVAGTVSPPVRIIDNGAAGNTRTGAWGVTTGKGYQQDIHSTAAGNGSRQSNWTFTGLASGQYRVWGAWTGGGSNASNAPFQFFSGGSSAPTVRVNQKPSAANLTADGWKWNFLRTVTVTNGWLMVRLHNGANGTVVADAIRLVTVPPMAPQLSAASSLVGLHADAPPQAGGVIDTTQSNESASGGSSAPSHERLARPVAQRPREIARHDSEFGPELSLLEKTLDLVAQSRRSSRPVADEFDAALTDWLRRS